MTLSRADTSRNPPLLTSDRIRRRVDELARTISDDFAGRQLVMIVVLKGGLIFAADLMRRLSAPVVVDFIRARSYRQTNSTGHVEFTCLPELPLAGKHVLLVEDILDTGRTAAAIRERLLEEKPASLALCALLDKPGNRQAAITADYVGFTIDNQFVVGYGLDYEQDGRALPSIHILENGAD